MQITLVADGDTFIVQPLPAMRAFGLQPRIAPALGELLAALASVLGDGGLEKLLDIDMGADKEQKPEAVEALKKAAPVLAMAAGRIADKLPGDELEKLTRELLATTMVNGRSLSDVFDVKMMGRARVTWRLLWAAVKVNFPDFFGAGARRAQPENGAPPQ